MNNHHEAVPGYEHAPSTIEQLAPGEERSFSIGDTSPETLDIFTGGKDDMMSASETDDRMFRVVDLRDSPRDERGAILYEGQALNGSLSYLLVQPGSLDFSTGKGFKGLRNGEVVDMGRKSSVAERFSFSDQTSREHFSVGVDEDGALIVGDRNSSNGTSVRVRSDGEMAPFEPLDLDHSAVVGVPGVGEQGSVASEEKERPMTRNERIFAFPEPMGRDRFGNDRDRRLKVTEESTADAELVRRYADQDIREFLFAVKKDNPDVDQQELLRTDNELRVKLGEYLLGKLEQLDHLPSRFYQRGETKTPRERNYASNLSSQEYAALLAISMLDGTFKKALNDPIEVGRYGEVELGQHRYGAMKALGVVDSPVGREQIVYDYQK